MKMNITALQLLKACIVQLEDANMNQPVRVQIADRIFIDSENIKNLIENPKYAIIGKIDFDELTWETICKQLGADYGTTQIEVIVK